MSTEGSSIRCPACKAENATGPQCRRCRADLTLLFALEARRNRLLAESRSAAAAGDWETAADLAGHTLGLRRGEDAAQMLALAQLMRRDFARAWQTYQDMTAGSDPRA